MSGRGVAPTHVLKILDEKKTGEEISKTLSSGFCLFVLFCVCFLLLFRSMLFDVS